MKSKLILSVLFSTIIMYAIIGCNQTHKELIPIELTSTIDSFYNAIENNLTTVRVDLFTENAFMLPNHWTSYQGKESIAKVINLGKDAVFKIRNREMLEINVSGSLAYTINSYEYTYHAKDETPQWHKTKNVHIWNKLENGEWKLHIDIWNSDVPISQFSSE